MTILEKIKIRIRKFPSQFWFIIVATLVFSIGASMVWPYLNIYLREKLDLPLRYTTLLLSLRAVMSISMSSFAGTAADRFGRRGLILISLCAGTAYYFLLSIAFSMWHFAILMGLWGALDLLYPVGVNAMIADMIKDDDRLEAYSLFRMVYNAGYAIGPIIGGFMAARSYTLMFYSAAIGYALAFLLLLRTTHETLTPGAKQNNQKISISGYAQILRDRSFISAVVFSALIYMGTSTIFNLLALYAGENYGISENQVSFVFTVNAVLCVTLQLGAIRIVKKIPPFKTLAISACLYSISIAAFALIPSVPWFCLCMVFMTIAEVLLSPTLLGMAAWLAPEDARGRYMSILSVAHPMGMAIGPAFFGYMYDLISPQAIFYGGSLFSFLAFVGFLYLSVRTRNSSRLNHL